MPALWAERAREKEVTRKKKLSPKIQSGTGRQAEKEHAVAMGSSFLFEKNCNQRSDQWHKQQQQAKDWRKKYSILAIFIIQCFWDTLLTTSLSPRSLIPALRSTQHGVAASGPQNHVPETHQMVSRDVNSSLELQNNPQVIPKF